MSVRRYLLACLAIALVAALVAPMAAVSAAKLSITATISGQNVNLRWSGGTAPYTIVRTAAYDTKTVSDTLLAGTTTTTKTDTTNPFRMTLTYSVTDANGQTATSRAVTVVAGSGTAADPFQVRTLDDLDNLRFFAASGNAFRQVANIDAAPTADPSSRWYDGGGGWRPIGTDEASAFTGIYDGNNCTITSLTIDRPTASDVGLFGWTSNATLKNMRMVSPRVTALESAGSIAGWVKQTTLSNCAVSGCMVLGIDGDVGGLVGRVRYPLPSRMEYCSSTSGTVEAAGRGGAIHGFAGSLAAEWETYSSIYRCFATGEVRGTDILGGLVSCNFGTMDRCWFKGEVNGKTGASGPVIENGGLAGCSYGTIKESYAVANVTGGNYVGGLVGENHDYIIDCYFVGKVFADPSATIVGPIAGRQVEAAVLTYYDSDVMNLPADGYGTPMTTALMQTKSTFENVGWDFAAEWDMPAGGGYPILR